MSIRVKGRLAGAAILGLAFVASNVDPVVGSAVAAGGSGGNSAGVSAGGATDPIDATSDAQRHLPRFVEYVIDRSGQVRFDASIKVEVKRPDGLSDLVWLTPAAEINGIYKGRTTTGDPRSPEALIFEITQVRDWSFIGSDGRMYGNFRTRAALSNLDAASAAPIIAVLSDDAVPADW